MATMILLILIGSVHAIAINSQTSYSLFSKACETVRYDKVNLVLDCMKSRSKTKKMKCITNIRQAQLMCEETKMHLMGRQHHKRATKSPIPDLGRLHNIYKLHSGDK